MNRDIKFRGLRTDGKGWVYGSLVNNLWVYSEFSNNEKGSPVCEIITGEYDGDCWDDIIEDDYIVTVIPKSVGQFTGFKDKKGNDIYNGDVLSIWVESDEGMIQSKQQVYWCEKIGAWKLDDSFSQNKSSGLLLSKEIRDYTYEITGTIHEKKDLIP